MRWIIVPVFCSAVWAYAAVPSAAQPKLRRIAVTITTPSSAEKIKIQEIWQTKKELWVLSQIRGGGVGLAVISRSSDAVRVKAPKLPVKQFVLGKRWNWSREKYVYLKSRKPFDELVSKQQAKRIFKRKIVKKNVKTARYIIMYHKNIFVNGKTKDGLTLKQLADKHAKQFGGKVGRILRIINGYTIDMAPAAAKRLERLPEVRAVEKDRVVGIN